MLYPVFNKSLLEEPSEYIEQFIDYDDLTFTTQLHGGFGTCTIRAGGPKDLVLMRYQQLLGSHLVVYDPYFERVYEGRVQDISEAENGIELMADGYYSHANEVLHGMLYTYDSENPTTVTEIVDDCIQLTENVRSTERTWKQKYAFCLRDADVNVTELGDKDYTQAKIGEVLEEILKLGYQETDGTPIYFAIWQDRIAYLWKEIERNRMSDLKSVRFWLIDSHNIVDPRKTRSRSSIFNKIWGVYEGASGSILTTSAAENKLSQGMYGIREGTINVGMTYQGIAEALRDAAIERSAWPVQAYSLRITGLVKHLSGMILPTYWIKAGDYIMCTYEDPNNAKLDDPLTDSTSAITGMVTSTSYSTSDNVLQLEINSNDTRFEILLARLGIGGSIA